MIVCRKCSRRHADGTDFCVCGAFLEFDGEHVPDDLPAPGAAPPAAPPPPRSSPPTPPTPDWGSAPPTRPAAEPAPWSGFEPAAAAEPEPSWGSVRAQLPDAPVTPTAHDTVEVRPTMRAGDTVCVTCGTPNPPTRQFCQKCGNQLTAGAAAAAAAAPADRERQRGPSWWSRSRRSARRKGLDTRRLATEAHMLSRGGLSSRSVLFRTGGIVVLLGGMLAFLGPWQGSVRGWARDRLGASRYDLVDLEPEQVTSEDAGTEPATQFPLQGPDKVIDRHRNTSWATRWLDPVGQGLEAVPDDASCQTAERTDSFLRVTFPEPTDLGQLSIIGGRYDGDETRGTFFRPRVLELRWAEDQCSYIELPDTGELSAHGFEHDEVEVLEIRVVGVYADTESQPVVDISEIVLEHDR